MPFTQEQAIDTLTALISAKGLQNTTIDILSAKAVRARGYKTISGQAATYHLEIHLGTRGALTLIAVAKSSDYPTNAISKFFSSVEYDAMSGTGAECPARSICK
jgi:hypothetical protein